MLSLMRRSITIDAWKRMSVEKFFDAFFGDRTSEEYQSLLTYHEQSETHNNTPYTPISFNTIAPRFELLLGDLEARGFELGVEAINQAAIERKNLFKKQLQYQMNMQPVYEQMAEYTGLPFGLNNNLPKNIEELEAYMDEYRDLYEELIEAALEEYLDDTKYSYRRAKIFLDLLTTGRVHNKIEYYNGKPFIKRIPPRRAIFDLGSEDSFLEDQSYFLEYDYMPIPQALEFFDMTSDVMEEMIGLYERNEYKNHWNGLEQGEERLFSPFALYGERGWRDTMYDRVLVITAEWIDYETVTRKVTYDPHGNQHIHVYFGKDKASKLTTKEKKDTRSSLEQKKIQVVRHASLIAGNYVTNFGIKKNEQRRFSRPELTELSYQSYVHHKNGTQWQILAKLLMPLQDMKDYVLTIMQKEITKNVGSLVAVDIAKIADFYGVDEEAMQNLLHNIKAFGVVAYDSSKTTSQYPGQGGNPVPFNKLDSQMQGSILEALQIAQYLDAEMDRMSGVNESRSGTMGERKLASVGQMEMMQLSKITESLFRGFTGFEEYCFERLSNYIALAWKYQPERYERLVARLGVSLPDDFEIDVQEYKAYITTSPQDRNGLMQAMQMSLAQGNLAHDDFLLISMLMSERGGMKKAIKKYLKIQEKRRKEAQEMEAKRQQLMQQQQQGELEKVLAQIQAQGDQKIREIQEKNKGTRRAQTDNNILKERLSNQQLAFSQREGEG